MGSIRHTGIYVNDMETMVSFYQNIFDLDIAVRQIEKGTVTDTMFGEPNMVIDVCKLKFPDGGVLELIHCMREFQEKGKLEKIYSVGQRHIAITVESADSIYEKLNRAGCKVLSNPCRSEDGKVKVFFAQDLECNYLEIVEEII